VNSSFTQKPDLALLAFDASQPSSIHSVEQPAPATQSSYLDAIADRVLHRLAYRTLAGGVLSYVLNFTVNVSGVTATTASNYQAGIRWVELRRNPGTGAMTINQQGTYAPGAGDGANGRNVWMGSVAQDHQGDIALGFSASSSTQFPSVMYAGRLPGDSAGTLAQGEATLFAGSGSQQHTAGRWGDYSAMSVDPADECTFWYTNQYLNASGSSPWRTRIGSFKVDPNCAAPQKGTITGVITNCVGGTPVQGASITTPEGFFRQTDATGNYSISVAPGTYNLSVSKPGSGFNTCTGNVTVSAGGTGTFSCCLQPAPIIVSTSASFVSEGCAPANGAIDPGETVTMSLCLKNTGGLSTTNLAGTLQATGGVSNPGGAQTYGIVVAGGVPVCQNFTFTASGTCSGTLTATVQLQDGATNLGTITYTFVLGSPRIAFDEKFDGITAPALPGGWVAANAAGGAPLWVTSTTGPDTSPNCVFVDCPSSESDKRLDTPPIPIVNATALLSFRHNYLFRDSGGGFDGGVLEVSSPNINGGAFTDLTNPAVGGSFVQNGYTSTIDIDFGSPIGGRQAWSGSSNGYLTTTANLGSNVAGHTIKLRWRMGSDESISDTGWFIDTIVINDGNICCVAGGVCTITCPANITKPTDSNQCSAVVNYAAPTTSGNCGTVTCAPASGSAFAKGVTTVNCTTAAGPSCSFTVTVQDTQAPTLTCPAHININGNCPTAVNYSSPPVSDNCSGAGLPVCNPPSGSAFPVGTTGVTCNVTDASGNPGSCSFNITVTGTPDLQPPTFPNGSPQPINVAAAFQCPYATSAQVNYTNPIAADNCAGVTVACNPPSGSTFPVGATVVTCTATDTSNNIATRSFAVTVYSACLADETNTLNVVMFNAATGDYRYCCSGALVATGRGTLTVSGCDVTIEHLKGDRRVRISVTGAGQGSGTAFVQRGGVQGCQITDLHMNDSVCNCP
ncbi:MAG: HYR domain-containing protein, partial [Blastocatellia bacterium]